MEGMMKSTNPKVEGKSLVCVDCGAPFVFSAGEQRYFFSKGLSIPKRCPNCRRKRRQTLVPEVSHDWQ